MSVITPALILSAGISMLKSKPSKMAMFACVRKINKHVKLKPVICIIVDEYHRRLLNDAEINFDENKYQFYDPELIFSSGLDDGELMKMKRMKVTNTRAWALTMKVPFKEGLNAMRWEYRDEQVILFLSNIELAKKLHINKKNIFVYEADMELFEKNLELQDEVTKSYSKSLRKNNMKHVKHEYGSINQLVRIIEGQLK
jgi:hypothetical protein